MNTNQRFIVITENSIFLIFDTIKNSVVLKYGDFSSIVCAELLASELNFIHNK